MSGGVAKIQIPDTCNELGGMDFVEFGYRAAFLHIRDSFSRFPATPPSGRKKETQSEEEVRDFTIAKTGRHFRGT